LFRFLYENNFKTTLPRIIGLSINFLWFISVFFCGYIGFMKDTLQWKKKCWTIIHTIVLLFLISGVIVEKATNTVFINQWRDLFGYTRSFFTSPLPFLILWVLPSVFQLSKKSN
jgi:ribose/xylose/arabinose/galactoside ABC-type transport system permease subunit